MPVPIYLDNAATSFPKPPSVSAAVKKISQSAYGNPGRGGHLFSRRAAELVFSAREKIGELLACRDPQNVCFFGGATQALNVAIHGAAASLLEKKERLLVLTDVLEHNSVLRPLYSLEKRGRVSLAILTPEEFYAYFAAPGNPVPDLIVTTLRSNVTGARIRPDFLSQICRDHAIPWIADAAQAFPAPDTTFRDLGADLIAAPSHKGLCGVMGGGFLAMNPESRLYPEAVFTGGSGNRSADREMPPDLPEHLEAGTLPLPAIASMLAGAEFTLKIGLDEIRRTERRAKQILVSALQNDPRFQVFEPEEPDGPVLYNRLKTAANEEAEALEEVGVYARAGFHCAPLAHAYYKTGPSGAVRLSPGPFTTDSVAESAARRILSLP